MHIYIRCHSGNKRDTACGGEILSLYCQNTGKSEKTNLVKEENPTVSRWQQGAEVTFPGSHHFTSSPRSSGNEGALSGCRQLKRQGNSDAFFLLLTGTCPWK